MKSRIKNTVSSDNEGITCPHCNVFAQHTFVQLSTTMELNDNLSPILEEINAAHFFPSAFHEYSIPTSIAVPMIHNCKYKYYCSQCIMCHDLCVWQYDGNNRKLLYPRELIYKPLPENIGEEISTPYEQARIIASDSPPAACMLLRLCLEKICIKLKVKKQNLVDMIEEVSSKYAFTPMFEMNMEVIRLAGNISAHKDLNNKEIDFKGVTKLISFTHLLIEYTIEKEKNIKAMHKKLKD